jgi:hypothetical protein
VTPWRKVIAKQKFVVACPLGAISATTNCVDKLRIAFPALPAIGAVTGGCVSPKLHPTVKLKEALIS